MRGSLRVRPLTLAATLYALALCMLIGSTTTFAGHVRLKNGTRIDGVPVPIAELSTRFSGKEDRSDQIIMIDNGMQRYFVPRRNVVEVNQDEDFSSQYDQFKIPQQLGQRSKTPATVGVFSEVEPFDQFGRRTITISTPNGPEPIVQAVTLIRPDYIVVNALKYDWQFSLATTSIPVTQLDAMIRQVTNQESASDRMSIYRFYVQARMLAQAGAEMDAMKRDFPDLGDRLDEISRTFIDFYTQEITTELRHRRDAGQHELAAKAVKQFPLDLLGPEALREVGELSDDLTEAKEQIDLVNARIAELQTDVTDEELKSTVSAYRVVIAEQLSLESLPRMSAFLNFHDADDLSAEEKLALAFSGWVLGGGEAITNLPTALRLWQARFLILEFMRSENLNTRNELVKTLSELEGVGPETVAKLIPFLPPFIETPELTEDVPFWIQASKDRDEIQVRYQVLLPHEYSPHHRYPLIVSLHPVGRDTADSLMWWGGTAEQSLQSRRRGYIVIAPEYLPPGTKDYDFSPLAHYKVLESLRDARKRFRIDSDRVFLSGHGMGGDAAFDIGMSHAYEFAGVIPVTGLCEKFCKFYFKNAEQLSWYIVAGERDRDLAARNAGDFDRMMRYGFDIIYTEYTGRGYESYYSEIHKLFDWMDIQRRAPSPKEVEHKFMRHIDNRVDWLMTTGISQKHLRPVVWTNGTANVRPVMLTAKVLDGSPDHTTISITTPGDHVTLWLSPQLVDYSKRLQVRVKSATKFNDYLQPNIGHMLDDLRINGDRERFCWTRLDL